MSDPILKAREDLIEQREQEGRPFSEVVTRGIRSGQWDKGDLVRQHLKNNAENPLHRE